MKILQIVPLITPTNEYGGPTTVALQQCEALQAAGHEVILAAGTWGYTKPPETINGIRLHLFPARSLSRTRPLRGITAPRIFPWLRAAARTADIVHVHLARDLLTLPSAMWCALTATPFVVQTHGMVADSKDLRTSVFDALMTHRVMTSAGRVFYLTDTELRSLRRLFPNATLEYLRNGIAHISPYTHPEPNSHIEVLFLARIQERKRPLDFIAMATALAPEFPNVTFRMIGPDEGLGTVVQAAIANSGVDDRLSWDGPLPPSQATEAFQRASIYVLPSVDEPYPMTVLEAMAAGLPVIITETCGLAPLVREHNAGLVIGSDFGTLIGAVRSLLTSPRRRLIHSQASYTVARDHLDITNVADQLDKAYKSVLAAKS